MWNDIAGLLDVSPKVLRVLDTQINDYTYTTPEQHAAVDLYLAPSAPLARRLKPMAEEQGGTAPWAVAPNGCNPEAYNLSAKVPGRCIYASSPDRGLHVALEQWRTIRAAVPHATLRIFYHSMAEWFGNIERNSRSHVWNEREHARRATIVRDLLPELESEGVTFVGGVSREQMAREYSEAECLAFPVDTISYTEGFAVAILEGLAAGAVPCISSCDAIGEIYAGVCPMVDVADDCSRFTEDFPLKSTEWARNVAKVLVDKDVREEWQALGCGFAERHAWPVLGEKLEAILVEAKERKQ